MTIESVLVGKSKNLSLAGIRSLLHKPAPGNINPKFQKAKDNKAPCYEAAEEAMRPLMQKGPYILPSEEDRLKALQEYPPSESELALSKRIQFACKQAKKEFDLVTKELNIKAQVSALLKDLLQPKMSVSYVYRRTFFRQIARVVNEELNNKIIKLKKRLDTQKSNLVDFKIHHERESKKLASIDRQLKEIRSESKPNKKELAPIIKNQKRQSSDVTELHKKVKASMKRIETTSQELAKLESSLIHESEIQAAFAHLESCPIAA